MTTAEDDIIAVLKRAAMTTTEVVNELRKHRGVRRDLTTQTLRSLEDRGIVVSSLNGTAIAWNLVQ